MTTRKISAAIVFARCQSAKHYYQNKAHLLRETFIQAEMKKPRRFLFFRKRYFTYEEAKEYCETTALHAYNFCDFYRTTIAKIDRIMKLAYNWWQPEIADEFMTISVDDWNLINR